MKWTSDGNRLSVHHLKHVVEPKLDFDKYNIGDEGLAVYPGYAGKWAFVILAIGGKHFDFLNFTAKSYGDKRFSDMFKRFLRHVLLNYHYCLL